MRGEEGAPFWFGVFVARFRKTRVSFSRRNRRRAHTNWGGGARQGASAKNETNQNKTTENGMQQDSAKEEEGVGEHILRKGKQRRRHVDVFLRGFFVIAGETRRKDVREAHLVSKKAAEAKKGDVNDK